MIHAFHQTVRLRRYHHHYQHHHCSRFVNNDAVTSSMSLSSIPQGPTTTSLFLKSRGTTSTRTTAKLFMSTDQNQNQMIQRTVGVGSHVSEMEVKKSRFIGYTKHVENWDQAQTYIEQVKLEHPKARHWCFGFRCGTNPIQERCSDDGEPTGTGKANDNLFDICICGYFGVDFCFFFQLIWLLHVPFFLFSFSFLCHITIIHHEICSLPCLPFQLVYLFWVSLDVGRDFVSILCL